MAHSLKMVKLGFENWGTSPMTYRDQKYEAVNTLVHGTDEGANHATLYGIAMALAKVQITRYNGNDPEVSDAEKNKYYQRAAECIARRQQRDSGAAQASEVILSHVIALETLVDTTKGTINFTESGAEDAWNRIWQSDAHRDALARVYAAQQGDEIGRAAALRYRALIDVAEYALFHSEAVAAELAAELPSRADVVHLEESVEAMVAVDDPVQELAYAA